MSEWICIKCETTMLSKCPGQRSTFYSMEVAAIRSSLATHVLNVDASHKEVFLNLSYWGEGDPVIGTINQLAEWKEKLDAVTCDHYFILNSETETKCRMGCTHSNLTDKERLLKEEAEEAETVKPTFESLKKEYIDFLGTQLNLAKTNLMRLCPSVTQAHPTYNKYRRWYFVFQDEMDQIKYELQNGLERLSEGQPYRKKYEVRFGYDSDIPNLYTDDLFQAEAVYKDYRSRGVKCHLGELRHEKKDSTSIGYYPMEQDVDRRLKCCECGSRLKPGDKLVVADITEYNDNWDKKQIHIFNHGEVMCAKCNKKITDRDKEFHRVVIVQFSEEEMNSFSHYRDRITHDVVRAMRERWFDFRRMEVTDVWTANRHGRYRIRIKGLGHQFDELKKHLKP